MKTFVSSRYLSIPVVLVFCCLCAVVFTNSVSSEGPGNFKKGPANEAIQMFDIGFGSRTLNLQLGRETKNHYLGSAALQQAIQSGQLQPRTMVSEDFNGDGMGDLVIGYANGGGGVLSMRQGNVQAIAPTGEVFQGITQGRYPEPFLHEAKLYELPEAPDFLQVGDFNSDGYEDVLAAARGGAALYVLAGNGQGTLGAPQRIDLSGQLTALQADDFRQPGKFTSLALGVRTPDGPKALVYQDGLSEAPAAYSMQADVTALALGRLDDDDITDVAAAAMNQLTVIHGRNGLAGETSAKPAVTETEDLQFAIAGLAVGDFMFDRGHQREIAVLSGDGSVHISARGNPDTRPYTKEEKDTLLALRRDFSRNKIDLDTLIARTNPMIRANRSTSWNVAQTIGTGVSPAFTDGGQAVFQRLNGSNLPTDDLLIGDRSSNRMQVVKNEQDTARLNIVTAKASPEPSASSVDGAPLAAVSMRLGVDLRPGRVVLRSGQIEPEIMILAPDAVYTVNSTADLPDDVPTFPNATCHASNGLCTLRAAVMQSNHNGGSNTIMVPDGTYTLSLGPPDDEANTGGALEQSGDLDIFSWQFFNNVTGDTSPILTAVSITGGTRDGCIIQMGTLSPTLGTNVPNNKERILEVNDSAVGPGADRVNVTLTNLTMQNAVEPTGSGTFLDGGAVRFDGFDFDSNTNIGLLTLHNVKLSNNVSAGFGGGVFVGFGSLKIETTSIIRANTAQHKVGGGAGWTGGNTVETQFFMLDGSTVGGATAADGNLATDAAFGAAAGIDLRGGLMATMQNSSVVQNNVGSLTGTTIGGGGVQINTPSVVFSNSTISNNTIKSNGGGIFNSARNAVTNAPSTLTLTTMNVNQNIADSDNSGAGDGGGIYNFFGTAIVQTTSHVDGNSAVNGGGIFQGWTGIAGDSTAGLTVQTGSTIGQAGAGNGNSAKNNGGSIAIQQNGATTFGPITLNSLTFTNNTANSDSAGGGDGGAIFISAGTITSLNTCTIDSNVANAGTGDGIRQTGGAITGAGTLNVNGGDSISISGGTFTSTPGTLNITGNLLNNGGTFTHNSGTVVCNGSGAQTIGGSTAMTFNNFTVNNAAGVNLGGNATVAGTLTLTSGIFGVGTNTLTLTGPVSFTSGTIGSSPTGTVNYNQAAGGQNVAPGNYGNLTFNAQAKVLPNGLTVGIAGTFTTGGVAATITGSTVDFNGAGPQTIPVFNYNNLTSSNVGARTLAAGTIGVAGAFTPGTNTYTITGNTMDFNGAGAQTIPAFNYNNLTSSNVGARTLANAGTIGIAGVFTPGTNTYTVTGSTINFNGAGSQNIPGFTYFHLTSSGGGVARVLDPVNTIKIAGTFTPGTDVYTVTGSTIEYNGGAAQSLPATFTPYNNLTFNNPTTVTGGPAVLDVNGNLTITQGTFAAGASLTITVAGNWTNNGGTFSPSTSTVTFDGGAGQTIGGTTATTFNNLTNGNASGIAMNNDNTVNGILALTSSDITVAATKTLTQPLAGSSTGTFDVNGRVQRNGFVTGGATLSFGNPFNTIQVTAGTAPANIVVDLARSVPIAPIGYPNAVARTYTITPSAAGFTGTLRLHYLDTELNGNTEGAGLNLWRYNGVGWSPNVITGFDTTANWVEKTGVSAFSPWTMNSTNAPTASGGVITGRILDDQGNPVAGAVVRLSGTQTRKFITDANGVYRFENVETNGFYTVTPSRANYSFSPAERSFSQLGQATEATFAATAAGSGLVNPLDTPEYFVRQNYLDFLNREPDEAGFNFWSDQILGCGTDQGCIERKRVNVSAAYFLSIEFQKTGVLVAGLYRTAYGARPDFAHFLPDTRTIGLGVQVNKEGWEAVLAANTEAFVNSFVNRAEFHAAFDNLSPADYVDTLLSHTGVSFTSAERDALVNGLVNGTQSRADTLRSIAENGRFVSAKFNDTFVMMEYMGYLRRDADAAGFAFWLNKLNQFNGNFEQAEMVKAFILSDEYRNRFPR